LILADKDRVYLKSLSEENPLNDRDRERLINDDEYKGREVVVGLWRN
jgi:hypothetical protein